MLNRQCHALNETLENLIKYLYLTNNGNLNFTMTCFCITFTFYLSFSPYTHPETRIDSVCLQEETERNNQRKKQTNKNQR